MSDVIIIVATLLSDSAGDNVSREKIARWFRDAKTSRRANSCCMPRNTYPAARVPLRGSPERAARPPPPLSLPRLLQKPTFSSPWQRRVPRNLACRRLLCQPREREKSAPEGRGNPSCFSPPLLPPCANLG